MEDKYLDEVKLLVKWHDKKISDDEFPKIIDEIIEDIENRKIRTC